MQSAAGPSPAAAKRRPATRTTGATKSEIGADILAKSEAVNVELCAVGRGRQHGARLQVSRAGRPLPYVTVKDGVQGIGGYLSGKPFVATVKVDPYHAGADVPGPGCAAVDDRRPARSAFSSRDVEQVEVEIGRVLPNQLQHVAPQMWDFSRPSLYGGLEDRLVERFVDDPRLQRQAAGKADLRQHRRRRVSPGQRKAPRGLFLLHIRARARRPVTEDEPKASRTMTGARSKTRG